MSDLIRQVSLPNSSDNTDEDVVAVNDENDDDEDGYDLSQEDWNVFSTQLSQRNLDEDDDADADADDNGSKDCNLPDEPPTANNINLHLPLKRQTTLTQMDVLREDSKRVKRNDHFQDSEEKVFYDNCRTGGLQIYQIGEHYKIRHTDYCDCVFTIDSFKTTGIHKKAIGAIYQKFRRTWAHVDNASDKKFQKYVRAANLNGGEYVKYKEMQPIRLKFLGDEDKDFRPPSNDFLIYDKQIGKPDSFGAPGHGFTISYIHSMGPNEIISQQRIDDQFNQRIDNELLNEAIVKTDDAETYEASVAAELKRDEKLTVLDVFAGIGGMSQGFLNAGFDVKWAVEKNAVAAATHKFNYRDTFVFAECVYTWFEKLISINRTPQTKNNEKNPYRQVLMVYHLHFSPPCTAFSPINRGGKNDEDNAKLTLFCIDIIKHFYHYRMKSITMENVPGILYVKQNENYIKTVASALIGIGMHVQIQVIDSSRYGDPQKRSRVFLMAFKINLREIIFPKETHGGKDCESLVTVFDALGDLSQLDPTEGNGFVEVPEKDGAFTYVQHHCKDGTEVNPGMKKWMEKLKRNEPAHTIRRKGNVTHWDLDRKLTVREMGNLQSFPDTFEFHGTRTQQIDGIGNAVAIKTGTAVGATVLQSIQNSREIKRKIVIVTGKGANVRRYYRISETDEAFGKLDVGAVREIVTTRWLRPSERTDVRVKRYQIKLLSRDAGNKCADWEDTFGWISDRGRLKDEQHVIAKEI